MRMEVSNTDSKGRHHRTEIFFKDSFVGIHQHGWQDEEKYLRFYQFHRKIWGAYYVKNEKYLAPNHAIAIIKGLLSSDVVDEFKDWLELMKEKYPQLF